MDEITISWFPTSVIGSSPTIGKTAPLITDLGAGVILYNKNSKKLDINRYADIDWLERLTNEEIVEKHCDITDFIETSHKAKIYAFYGTPVLMEIHKQIELGSFPAEGKVV